MAIWYLTGFEHGYASQNGTGAFDSVTAAGMSTASPRTGTYHFRVNAAGSTYTCTKLQTAGNYSAVHGYVKINTLPAGGTFGQIHSWLSGTATAQIEIDSSGVIQAAFRDPTNLQGTAGVGPTVTADGLYHRLEILYDLHQSPNVITFRWDGTEYTGCSFTNAARTGTSSRWGQQNTTATYQFDVDDWIAGDAAGDYPFGTYKVIKILPGSDGTHSFTNGDFCFGDAGAGKNNTDTDFYTGVDDTTQWTTSRSTTDSIGQRVLRSTGYVEIAPAATPETGSALAVRALLLYSASSTQSNEGACIIRSANSATKVIWGDLPTAQGGNNGALADYSETSNFVKGVLATVPGAGWTPTEVNALRWRCGGGATDITPVPTWQALMLEAAYSDAPVAASFVLPNRNLRTALRR